MKLAFVCGARGVGKTAVLKELEQAHGTELNFRIIHSSQAMIELSTNMYKKPLMQLDKKELFTVQSEIVKSIRSLPNRIVLFDTHHIKIDPEDRKITLLTPKAHGSEIDFHIVVEAEPQVILARRVADPAHTIKRSYNLEIIDLEIDAERKAAFQIAKETNSRVYIVKNETIGSSVKEITSILRRELKDR